MKILILDNYDSFTFNLYQYTGEIMLAHRKKFTLHVFKNNEITLAEIKHAKYDRIIISPGPGNPADPAYFGVCAAVIKKLGTRTPVLGICLGMQGIAHIFGGKIVPAKKPVHGKTSLIRHNGANIFAGLPREIEVMRYHSLVADKTSLPAALEITATTAERKAVIMALRHKTRPIFGVQFHPESFATEGGKTILANFLLTL